MLISPPVAPIRHRRRPSTTHQPHCRTCVGSRGTSMTRKSRLTIGITAIWLAALGGFASSAQDKYTVKVPGGLAFSEFRGYESWQAIGLSRNDRAVAMILGNQA